MLRQEPVLAIKDREILDRRKTGRRVPEHRRQRVLAGTPKALAAHAGGAEYDRERRTQDYADTKRKARTHRHQKPEHGQRHHKLTYKLQARQQDPVGQDRDLAPHILQKIGTITRQMKGVGRGHVACEQAVGKVLLQAVKEAELAAVATRNDHRLGPYDHKQHERERYREIPSRRDPEKPLDRTHGGHGHDVARVDEEHRHRQDHTHTQHLKTRRDHHPQENPERLAALAGSQDSP